MKWLETDGGDEDGSPIYSWYCRPARVMNPMAVLHRRYDFENGSVSAARLHFLKSISPGNVVNLPAVFVLC